MAKNEAQPLFFATPNEFKAWLKTNHATALEQWVGFHRKGSGRPSITWPEAVDEALCVGWIDGIRKSVDETSYKIRFTPRRKTSIWSAVNIGRVAELAKQKRMRPVGLQAFGARQEAKSGVYAYEQRKIVALDSTAETEFQKNPKAWDFFQTQSATYRKVMAWWVISAKREETRKSRLLKLIDESEQGRRMR